MILYIGNRRYSSWSLRPALAAAASGLAVEERVIGLDLPGTAAAIHAVNPAGRVPVLHDGALVVHDSLAICEYLHELAPDAGLWPRERAARARARSIVAEMHSGFAALRTQCPMNLGRLGRCLQVTPQPDTARDLDRIATIWRDCRERFGQSGPWLFGNFCIADAMFAPVVLRWVIYGLPRSAAVEDYVQHWLADIDLQDWIAAAQAETETIDRFEQE